MNKLQFLNILANAPKNLKNYPELLDYARNVYKQIMGVFPEGIDNISIKQAADEVSKNRKKVVQFPPGGKDKTDFFSTRPDPRVKQPSGAKMDIQRANENLAGGANYAEGDTKYNADILGTELARVRGFIKEGQDATDMDPSEYSKLYDEAYSYLTQLRFLNRPPKKEGVKSIDLAKELEELTNKNLKERGLGEIKLGDKLPPPKNKKPDVDPVLQQSEDQKQLFLDFEGRNKTKPGSKIDYDKISEGLGGVKLRGNETFEELLEIEKNLNKPKKAKGGRIGFDKGGGTGVAGDQMEGDQYVISDIPGNPQVPMGQFGPLNVGIFGGGSYGKNEIIPGVDMATTNQNYGIVGQFPIGNTGFSIGGNYLKSRVNERFTGGNNQVFKTVPTDSDRFNIGINFKKPLSGGRFGLKEGGPPNPGRRNFMKLMAGLASLPVIGKLFKGAKVAEKVVQLKNTTTTMPAWFPQFVEKFISKGVGKKIDQDLMEFTNPDLPNIKVTKADDGRVFVEGQNDYYKNYEIDYTPPGYEVVDEKTGKAVKTKGDFMAQEEVPVNVDPDGNADFDAEVLESVDDILSSDARAMEEFATGKKVKEMKRGEYNVGQAEARAEQAAEEAAELSDEFSQGGLAYMLGE
jgi:hypothetical protein